MAKTELFTYTAILTLARAPRRRVHRAARRGRPRGGARWRAACCARGSLLGIFVEGTRQPTEEIGRGAARGRHDRAGRRSARGAGSDPGHASTSRSPRRHPVTVVFGPPLQRRRDGRRGRAYRDAVVAATAELQSELERLQRRAQAAIAAGRPARPRGRRCREGGMSDEAPRSRSSRAAHAPRPRRRPSARCSARSRSSATRTSASRRSSTASRRRARRSCTPSPA